MKALLPLIACSASLVASLPGAVILYNFDDPSGTVQKLSADKTGADAAAITASDFTAPGDASVSASTDTAFLRSDSTGTDLSSALASTHYFTFTLTPVAPGVDWQVNSFTFKFGASNNFSNTDFNNTVVVQTSFGGTGTGNPILTVTPSDKLTGDTGGSAEVTTATVDVSGITFDLASPLEVQFRFYDDSNSTGIFNRLDDISINVSAVPEPSAALLAALGLAGAALRRRR